MAVSESNWDEWQLKPELEQLIILIIRDQRDSSLSSEDFLEVITRPEIRAIFRFGESSDTGGALYDAMQLFWGVYELWKDGHMSVLPARYEDIILDWFEHFQRSHRVPYVPDSYDGLDNHDELFIYLHIAAARAFRIRKGKEISEEVLDCLIEVERTLARLGATSKGPGVFFGEAPSYYTSAGAILAMVFMDLWRIRQAEGRYADALHYLSGAAQYFEGAAANFYGMHIDELWPEVAEKEHYWETRLQCLLTGLDVTARDMVNTFQSIRSNTGSVDDWVQVARDCGSISNSPIHTWDFAELRDSADGHLVALSTADSTTGFDQMRDVLIVLNAESGDGLLAWGGFWHGAKMWASAQFSPSEYRKMREDDEKHAAETRLKNYFFGIDWPYLPERAQHRLINADLIWNSPQRVSRESVLNDLLRVVEEMCEQFMFQPLMNEERTRSEILSIEGRVSEDWRRASLGVREYIWICNIQSLPSFLEELQLAEDEIQFVTRRLPTAMRQLTDARNPAEHEVGSSAPPKLVNIAYRLYLGIGQPGILPELARIGRKLQVHRPRR